MGKGDSSRPQRGTPQGGVASPLLSTILLTAFDREMRRKGYQLTRYADGTPVQMSNLRGGSPLILIVRSGI